MSHTSSKVSPVLPSKPSPSITPTPTPQSTSYTVSSAFYTYQVTPSYGTSTSSTLHCSVDSNPDGSTIIFAEVSDGERQWKGQKRIEAPPDEKGRARNEAVVRCLLDPEGEESVGDCVKLHLNVEGQNTDSSRVNLKLKQTLTSGRDGSVDKILLQFPLSVQENCAEGRLSFMKEAAETFGKEMKKCKSLEEENANLKKVIAEWQSSTHKLSSQLQTREDELLSNFVVLLNSKKQEINRLKAANKKASSAGQDGASQANQQDKAKAPTKKKEKVTQAQKEEKYMKSSTAERELEAATKSALARARQQASSSSSNSKPPRSPAKTPPNNNSKRKATHNEVTGGREFYNTESLDNLLKMDTSSDEDDEPRSKPSPAKRKPAPKKVKTETTSTPPKRNKPQDNKNKNAKQMRALANLAEDSDSEESLL
ncbi:hypothetical protein TrVE_jg3924 [Triparma verrucosa]|uniref:XRCC4 n=1 Tax=Triparma verrucosa TaxID=1606542 RepID=A0A9W7C4Z4_9STRA|nr:hypothetical protein TrVE_jg3924 [Triparma verrucosa]